MSKNYITTIKSVSSREILDSRGEPTLETKCELMSGVTAVASVPSGKSTGKYEACELRDDDSKRYGGKGVLKAVDNVNKTINGQISGKKTDQRSLDNTLNRIDGTKNKSHLGANAILSVSLSFARACSREQGLELYKYIGNLVNNRYFKLPQPAFNIINGGKHADSGLDLQEFMIMPIKFYSFKEKVRVGAEIIACLKDILLEKGYSVGVGDEGGFAPKLNDNEKALDFIDLAIKKAGYSKDQVKISIDAAASSFFVNDKYEILIEGIKKRISARELISWYEKMSDKHQIVSIEDGLAEDDWDGFSKMMETMGRNVQIVGDDLTVTNLERIKMAGERQLINSVLIKPNQIGTLSETIDSVMLTKSYDWKPFVSHRSGETNDTFVADLAVGLSCDFIKAGSLEREERVIKYNRLMEIEEELISKNRAKTKD